jgi:hypothetical protein
MCHADPLLPILGSLFSPHLAGKHLRGVGVENTGERRPGDASKLVVPSCQATKTYAAAESIQ